MEKIEVYKLLDLRDCKQVLYVGSTVNPEQRLREHKRKKFKHIDISYKTIRVFTCKHKANKFEEEVTRNYWKQGLCLYNKMAGGSFAGKRHKKHHKTFSDAATKRWSNPEMRKALIQPLEQYDPETNTGIKCFLSHKSAAEYLEVDQSMITRYKDKEGKSVRGCYFRSIPS